jgi:hypothetical protein
MTRDYSDNELYSSSSKNPFPRIQSQHQYPQTFGPVASAPELAVGTPVAFDTSNKRYVVWSNGGTVAGADTIVGFVHPLPIQLHATKEVLGIVMSAGEIHYDDIVLPDGESEADLQTAIRANLRARGLYVRGLGEVR